MRGLTENNYCGLHTLILTPIPGYTKSLCIIVNHLYLSTDLGRASCDMMYTHTMINVPVLRVLRVFLLCIYRKIPHIQTSSEFILNHHKFITKRSTSYCQQLKFCEILVVFVKNLSTWNPSLAT